MEGDFRRLMATACADRILSLVEFGLDYGSLEALLADYAVLKRENDALKRENDALRRENDVLRRETLNLPGEEWRDVIGYEGLYQVSNLGRIKSFHRGIPRLMKPTALSSSGYVVVGLFSGDGSKQKSALVHRLVAEAFIPNPDNKPQVNHINGNKVDNRVENLEWCTCCENISHAYRTGLNPSGESSYQSKLTNEQVRFIRANVDCFSRATFSKMFNVGESVISGVILGKTYKHVK